MMTILQKNTLTVNDILEDYLIDTNQSLLKFSENSNISYSTLRRIKSGTISMSQNTYNKLSKYLNVTPSDLSKLPLK